jgi:hypothetical protein
MSRTLGTTERYSSTRNSNATIEAKKEEQEHSTVKQSLDIPIWLQDPIDSILESCSHVLSFLFRIFVRLPIVTLQRFIASAHLIAVLVETIEIAMLSEAV